MSKFELFIMIFYTLDYYWDQHQGNELGMFLSGMNPFLFKGEGSAVPDIYEDYCAFLKDNKISVDNSYKIALDYIHFLGKDYIEDAFAWVDEESWKEKCIELMEGVSDL